MCDCLFVIPILMILLLLSYVMHYKHYQHFTKEYEKLDEKIFLTKIKLRNERIDLKKKVDYHIVYLKNAWKEVRALQEKITVLSELLNVEYGSKEGLYACYKEKEPVSSNDPITGKATHLCPHSVGPRKVKTLLCNSTDCGICDVFNNNKIEKIYIRDCPRAKHVRCTLKDCSTCDFKKK